MSLAIVAAAGLATGSGIVALVRAVGAGTRGAHTGGRALRGVLVPVAVGVVVLAATRWPVAAALGALASARLPGALRREAPGASCAIADGVAGFTELLRDSLAASSGLAQAVVVTAPAAPVAVRSQVEALARRLTNGVPMTDALRLFAEEVHDPSAELLVCALLLAATSRAQRLADVLGAMAASMREDVAMRLRVDASRASARSSVRTITLFSLFFALALVVVAHAYLSPFGTATGQMVLAGVGGLYAAGLTLLLRLVRPRPVVRLLDAGALA